MAAPIMTDVVIDIYIPKERLLAVYQGSAKTVFCQARDGRSVRFPVNLLQRYVSDIGIKGSFCIRYDDNGRYLDMRRLS